MAFDTVDDYGGAARQIIRLRKNNLTMGAGSWISMHVVGPEPAAASALRISNDGRIFTANDLGFPSFVDFGAGIYRLTGIKASASTNSCSIKLLDVIWSGHLAPETSYNSTMNDFRTAVDSAGYNSADLMLMVSDGAAAGASAQTNAGTISGDASNNTDTYSIQIGYPSVITNGIALVNPVVDSNEIITTLDAQRAFTQPHPNDSAAFNMGNLYSVAGSLVGSTMNLMVVKELASFHIMSNQIPTVLNAFQCGFKRIRRKAAILPIINGGTNSGFVSIDIEVSYRPA